MISENKDVCCNEIKISKIFLLLKKDCIFEDNKIVRIKRKYGKFKRTIHVIDCK